MLIGEVKKKTGLSRKAIEYYEEKELIKSDRLNNNYRNYDEYAIARLKKISTYRRLGIGMEDIYKLLNEKNSDDIKETIRNKRVKMDLQQRKIDLFEELIKSDDFDDAWEKLKILEREEDLYTRLVKAFPGYYGYVFFMSYKPFLRDRVSEENEKYFNEFLEFLDSLDPINLSKEEKKDLEKISETITESLLEEVNQNKINAIEDPETWLEKNQLQIEEYLQLKKTQEFIETPIYKINAKIKIYLESQNYYQVAIPLIRKFSPSYNTYYENLLVANEKFLSKYKNLT